jgi:hypothetical protein
VREGVAGGNAPVGAEDEAEGPHQRLLPGLQDRPVHVQRVARVGPTEPPESALQSALAKAREREWWRLVSWQWDRGHWLCPSRTVPGDSYVLTVRPASVRSSPWWWRFKCSCPAEASGKYLACWHKAALYLRLRSDATGQRAREEGE